MSIEVGEEPIADLSEYACVPIAFEVRQIFDVVDGDQNHPDLLEQRNLATSYVKDYDTIPGEGPKTWRHRFDTSNWGLVTARTKGRLIGGAVVAFDSPGLVMLEGRRDLAVLWDIRVIPAERRRGVGSTLIQSVQTWALARGCVELKVETQNINVPACRFYSRNGFVLKAIVRDAYPLYPSEIQLLWHKQLAPKQEDPVSSNIA